VELFSEDGLEVMLSESFNLIYAVFQVSTGYRDINFTKVYAEFVQRLRETTITEMLAHWWGLLAAWLQRQKSMGFNSCRLHFNGGVRLMVRPWFEATY